MKLGLGTRSPIGTVISLIIIGACGFGSGCRNYDLVWSAEARSPDGNWLATAKEEKGGGFGNAFDTMSVYLKRIKSPDHPVEILEFSVGSSTGQSGELDLTMKWETPSYLNVTYNGRAATLYFQVVKCAGIDISAIDVSSANNTPQ